MESLSEAQEARTLIARCLAGDLAAARDFQEQYGELIYGYPIRAFRVPPDEAGDFYVFAFEKGRIFRRVRTFEGRAPFRAYLLGFVLDDLVLEWKRRSREVETVSMDTLGEFADPASVDGESAERANGADAGESQLKQVVADLPPPKSVIMKLLHVEDYEFDPPELRYLAGVSGVGIAEVAARIDRLRATVREREGALKRVQDDLDGVQAWIQLYERRVQRITEDLKSLPPAATTSARLIEERRELERKIGRRHMQRSKLLGRSQRKKVTAPYKEIAALLGTTVGNVGSQIARLRRELMTKLDDAPPEDGVETGDGGNNGWEQDAAEMVSSSVKERTG